MNWKRWLYLAVIGGLGWAGFFVGWQYAFAVALVLCVVFVIGGMGLMIWDQLGDNK